MDRLVRSIFIGGGAAVAVGGSLYFSQQQQKSSETNLPISISPEWNFKTKKNILQACTSFDETTRAKYFEQALDTLVTPTTNLSTKSESWLAGYADLSRSLGLATYLAQPDQALEPLKAAQSIPFGNPALRAEAQATLYDLTNDSKTLFYEGGDKLPERLESTKDIKAWSPLLLMRAEYKLQRKEFQPASHEFSHLHQLIDANNDSSCFKAQAGGFIAQISWKSNRSEDAISWLKASEMNIKCGTPACRETRQMIKQSQEKATNRTIEKSK